MNELQKLLAGIPPNVEWIAIILPDGVSGSRLQVLRIPTWEMVAELLYFNADRVVDLKCKPAPKPKSME